MQGLKASPAGELAPAADLWPRPTHCNLTAQMILVLFHNRAIEEHLPSAARPNVLLHPIAQADSLGELQRRRIGVVLCEWGDATPPAAVLSRRFPGTFVATLAPVFSHSIAAASRAKGYAEHFFFPLPDNFFQELDQDPPPPPPGDPLAQGARLLRLLANSRDYADVCRYAAELMQDRLAGVGWSLHLLDKDQRWSTRFISSPSWQVDANRLRFCLKQVELGNPSSSGLPGALPEEDLKCIPLVRGGLLAGALCCRQQDGASGTLEDLAAFLEPAFHHIDVLLEKERLSFTDTLTSLYNAQYLRQFLINEIRRCARYHKQVSILFIDIDWFKQVNDNHGHVAGSDTLVEISRRFSSMVRDSDVVVRYGGDEFVIVVTETAPAGAEAIAERVRSSIEAHVFGRPEGRNICLTVSIGVAGYPDHGSSVEELIRKADSAMYQAKSLQKNNVNVANQAN
ncbi:MAG: GGDEF domain-containing protein [Acidobacteria bacterium]|nr:GGDEF domain-containing protein [Acidobacteriota bacterium]